MSQQDLDLLQPLPEATGNSMYAQFAERVREVEIWTGDRKEHLDLASQNILANYSFFIYEALELNRPRKIDYRQVRKFASLYTDLFDSIFDLDLRLKLDSWIKTDVDMVEMGMYSRTNIYNKNSYH